MRYIKFAATIARRFSLRGMVASMSRTSVLQSFIDNNDADHPMSSLHPELIHTQVQTLRERGFVVAPGLVAPERCAQLKTIAERQLREAAQPLEFEADLRYPGAPESRYAPGGHTVRRLLDAYARDAAFAERATAPEIGAWMRAYFDETPVLSRAHHNCVMTKHPAYGSLTGWHRDVRYWSFERPDLVSVWLALGPETDDNGALWLVPGSHGAEFGPERFDEAKFFRGDVPANRRLIEQAVCPALAAGDVVFFHCNTLHSAGQNRSDQVKFSLVFTYHGDSNRPVPGSRSASKPEVRF
ncbi:phytanoyl-CoA dioxygenase family protein [Burkholderia pseudomallei]|uniref:phytanoyl-CoA dioxygenase family protein n=1 Tax=Burkholderia pseudomallei TaxID=28450 RepID=UPI00057294F7|nr:phytanoyl-CoA dioxygenase family protein [Burkholderia pseudomallei]KIX36735.1 phytanoyl-CoA dioxygenase [Burkholderia pseudomallei]ONC19555.1 phytanoyl-CoA dioxygenase [Burkholderia pseudomallei]